MQAVELVAHAHRHDDFFERRIAGTLTDTVDGAFNLPRAAHDTREAVGHGHAEVVMAVHGQHYRVDAAHVLLEVAEDFAVFLGDRIAHRVRDIDSGGAGSDNRFDHFGQKLEFRTRSVFRRKLDIGAQRPCMPHARHGGFDDFFLRHVQLVLAMDGTGGQKDVDARLGCVLHCLPAEVDVLGIAAGEAGDDRALHFARNGVDGLPVALGSHGKASLDDVHAELRQRPPDPKLLRQRHAAARRLLAVTQRGVEDQDAVCVAVRSGHHPNSSRGAGGPLARAATQ